MPTRRSSCFRCLFLACALVAPLALAAPTAAAVWRADAEQDNGPESFQPWDNWNGGSIGAQFAVVDAPVRQGKRAYRFTVRPRDYFGSNRSSERSELIEGLKPPHLENFAEDGVRYIAFSLYLPDSWRSPQSFGIVLQVKPTSCLNSPGSPSVSISLGGDSASVTTRGGARRCGVADNEKNRRTRTVLRGELATGRWHDFALMVRLSSDGDGALELLHKLQTDTTYDVLLDETRIYTAWSERGEEAPPHYLRHGLYRGRTPYTNTIFSDGFAVGDSYAEVGVKRVASAPVPTRPKSHVFATVDQTIASGSTLKGIVEWRASVSGCEPTKVDFLVGGAVVLTEINDPFGDTPDFWNSARVPNGRYLLRARATCPAGVVWSPIALVRVAN